MQNVARLIAVLIAALVAASCGTPYNPCTDVSCSGHGMCVATGGATHCACNAGFTATGLACLDSSSPCAGVTCSNQGRCAIGDGGPATCTCNQGYVASGLSCVSATGPCAGVTCSAHGSCAVVDGGPSCTCETGYDASGLNCVATTGPCTGMTCSGHGACTALDGGAMCTCDAGYTVNGLTCVMATGPCSGVTCSGHGTCAALDGGANCTCESGYVASGTDCVMATGPCAGVTCSSHGTCAVAAGAASCTCDAGYGAMGLTCVGVACSGVTCSGHGTCNIVGGAASCACDAGYVSSGGTICIASVSPTIGGCSIFPPNHIFNTSIAALPADPNSAAYLTTIGTHRIHLDLGTDVDPTSSTYYGIPYNVVHGNAGTWASVHYYSADTSLSWDPTVESDCAVTSGATHTFVAPCTAAAAPSPTMPFPATPLIEGGIDSTPSQPYGDHHTLLLDVDTCRLWETYHTYPHAGGSGWDIFASASWDLNSNALRHADWGSSDAAGFPILPLLLRADEASTGTIHHAIRFTIQSSHIRTSYIWPARHLTTNGTASTSLPPMGQLFRLRASYVIPATYNVQSRAILQAMQTYGMYIADGGSDMYVQGEPSAAWMATTFSEVQSVDTSQFEAVDIRPIMARAGFDPNSAAVP